MRPSRSSAISRQGTPAKTAAALGKPVSPIFRPYGNVGDIYDYQSTGYFRQTMAMVNINTSVGRWVTLFGRYSYGNAHSDTDGLGTQPSDPYNFAADWGRSSLDVAHNLFLGGSIAAKWGLRFSPFIVGHSGTPFNITSGTDLYLVGTNTPTARPGIIGRFAALLWSSSVAYGLYFGSSGSTTGYAR